MNSRVDTERILDALLAPEADRLPDRVIEATLDQLARTRQRRALRVPWRFPTMPAFNRATGIAAVVLVAVVGAGALIYVSSSSTGGVGGQPATSPPPPTVAPTPAPSQVAPGITGFKPYTSKVYGYQMGYPSDWRVYAPATRAWTAKDGQVGSDDWPWADVFGNPEATDGDSIGLWVSEVPVGAGANPASLAGLKAWAQTYCEQSENTRDGGAAACKGFGERGVPMCYAAGGDACRPAIIVKSEGDVAAFFEDWDSTINGPAAVRVVSIGRPDEFPAAARYGGSVQLLKSFLSTMGVVPPQAGQVPGS